MNQESDIDKAIKKFQILKREAEEELNRVTKPYCAIIAALAEPIEDQRVADIAKSNRLQEESKLADVKVDIASLTSERGALISEVQALRQQKRESQRAKVGSKYLMEFKAIKKQSAIDHLVENPGARIGGGRNVNHQDGFSVINQFDEKSWVEKSRFIEEFGNPGDGY